MAHGVFEVNQKHRVVWVMDYVGILVASLKLIEGSFHWPRAREVVYPRFKNIANRRAARSHWKKVER